MAENLSSREKPGPPMKVTNYERRKNMVFRVFGGVAVPFREKSGGCIEDSGVGHDLGLERTSFLPKRSSFSAGMPACPESPSRVCREIAAYS